MHGHGLDFGKAGLLQVCSVSYGIVDVFVAGEVDVGQRVIALVEDVIEVELVDAGGRVVVCHGVVLPNPLRRRGLEAFSLRTHGGNGSQKTPIATQSTQTPFCCVAPYFTADEVPPLQTRVLARKAHGCDAY